MIFSIIGGGSDTEIMSKLDNELFKMLFETSKMKIENDVIFVKLY